MRKTKWYKLDNTAKLVPSITTDNNPNVFRLTVTLKDKIDPDVLTKSLSHTLEEFPLFSSTLNSGLFWHYLDKVEKKVKVFEDDRYPCSMMRNGFLYRVTYYKNRINLDVYHVLADGNGAMEFLKYLVCEYINLKNKLNKKTITNESTTYEKEKDDFLTYDKSSFKFKIRNTKRAYKLSLTKKDVSSLDVVEVHTSTKKIKEVAKKYNVTVTTFLTALYIKSIIMNLKIKDLKRPIGITLPVDLRRMFPSKTSRNFFYTIVVSYQPNSTNELEDIIEEVDKQLKEKLSEDNIQDLFNSYMFLENNVAIRVVPNLIKDFALKYFVKLGKKGQTTVLSNLGVISIPEEYEKYVESFSAMSSTNDLQLVTCSFKDNFTATFTSHFIPKDIERSFILQLKKYTNDSISIISNVRGDKND